MAKPRQKKEQEVAALTEKFQRMRSMVLTSTSGLKVNQATELRSMLRRAGVDYIVAKKTLVARALQAASLDHLNFGSALSTSFSLAFGYNDDEVLPARLLAQFAKTHESVQFLGGVVNGSVLTAMEMQQFSKLPSRDGLRSQLVGTLAAPVSGLVVVLGGILGGFVRVLDGYRQNRAVA